MKYILFLITFLLPLSVYADDVSRIVFITDPQTVGVSILSKEITIQAQTAGGASQAIPETFDLVFESNSQTGTFHNSSGNEVTTYMSKNTANKTFYYKDTTAGTPTITITATGRESKKSFSAQQQITIGSGATQSATATTTGSSAGSSTQTTTPDTTSMHSSSAPLSTASVVQDFEVSAGRSRMVVEGGSVEFNAVTSKLQNTGEGVLFEWSFGDGTVGQGKNISHTYFFQGEYIVVLNATVGNVRAVSRTIVRVERPKVSMNKIEGGVEIQNTSPFEINIEGWGLVSVHRRFMFPKDTIIGSGKKITIADVVSGMSGGNIELVNPQNKPFARYVVPVPVADVNIEQIRNEINTLSLQVSEVVRRQDSQKVLDGEPVIRNAVVIVSEEKKMDTIYATNTGTGSSTANTAMVFEAPVSQGLISRIFSIPISGFNLIRRLFVEE